ncbi:MAG TPA: ABC transporter substrate-binding protein [Pyrinomonadaceae bacterium]|jgi:ribose transport system substrate-binding protein|nr:ABC transporter substrate-binding protein [Pyrinomonadaceae bacterium]
MKSSIKQRKYIAVSLVAVMALFVMSAACAKKSAGGGGTGGKIVVGFSQMENNGPWRIAETNSMKEEARKRGDKYELVVTDAQGQTSKQVSDVEDLIARRVKAIFLAPREFEGLAPAIQAAKQAGIPVFLIDREAAGKAGEDYVTFIGSNFVEEGQRAGEWLVKQSNGRGGIVELTGTAGSSVANDRSQGFKNAIKDKPEMQIIASQTGDFTRATAQKVMENIIQSKGKEITAVYAHNDEMALGAIQALQAAGMKPGKDVLVVSVDGEKAALQAIAQGTMNVSVECNPRFGPIAFDTLEKHLNGEKVSTKIIVPDRFFDQNNAPQFVNEAY